MASKLITGANGKQKRVLVDSKADPDSSKYKGPAMGRSVTLADGTELTGADAANYGKTTIGGTTPKTSTPTTFSTGQGMSLIDSKVKPVIDQGEEAITSALDSRSKPKKESEDPYANLYDEGDETVSELERQKRRNEADRKRAYEAEQEMYDQLAIARTKSTAATIGSLKTAWDSARGEQEKANTASERSLNVYGLRSGTSRYAPAVAQGLADAQKSYGIARLQDLDHKYISAIDEARTALDEGKAGLAFKKAEAARAYFEEARVEIANQIEQANEIAAKSRETRTRATRDSAIAGLLEQGITDPKQMLNYLNFYDDGSPTGGDFTADEIGKTLDALQKSTGLGDLKELSGEMRDFYILEKAGRLPAGVTTPFQFIAARSAAGRKPDGGGGDDDMFSGAQKDQLAQAGLANADVRTRSIFVNSPPKFRQEFARNGYGNSGVTPENITKSLEEWVAINKDAEGGDAIEDLIRTLEASANEEDGS